MMSKSELLQIENITIKELIEIIADKIADKLEKKFKSYFSSK